MIGAITMLIGIGVYSAFIGLIVTTLTQTTKIEQEDLEIRNIRK